MLTGLTKDIDQTRLQTFFGNLANRLGGGAPVDIHLIDTIGVAYITFPSNFAAQKFYDVIFCWYNISRLIMVNSV